MDPASASSSGGLAARAQLHRLILVAILVIFAGLSVVYGIVTPLFEGPDEAAHFRYVQYLAAGEGLPAIGAATFEVLWEGLQQPPLYYAVAAALIRPLDSGDVRELLWANPHRGGDTGGVNLYYHTDREAFPWRGASLAVHLLRLLNMVLGVVAVLAAYLSMREISPTRPAPALAVAAVVAFNPQFLFMSGMVTNDVAVAALCSLAIWLLARGLRRRDLALRDAFWLGIVVALASATKPSGLALLLPTAAAVAVIAAGRRSWKILLQGWLIPTGLTVSLAGWWYVRGLILYGDPFGWNGLAAINAETIRGQRLTAGDALAYADWLKKSYWGVFGNGVLMEAAIYRALEFLMAAALFGLMLWIVRQIASLRRPSLDRAGLLGVGLCAMWGVIVTAALISFMQRLDATNQGRLLFPAISALAVLLVTGLSGWVPARLAPWPATFSAAGLLVVAIASPVRYIAPAYAQPPMSIAADPLPAHSGLPVRFGQAIELIGYRISPAEARPGSLVHLTLDWRCTAPMPDSYKLFVHLLGHKGERLFQIDTIPYRGRFATVLWKPGQTFRDEYDLFITGKARPSIGKVQIGFFPWHDAAVRLPVTAANGQPIGDHFELDALKIGPRENLLPPADVTLNASFGDSIALLGYSLSPPNLAAGQPVRVTLVWKATSRVDSDYVVFLHLLNSQGDIVAQRDGPPQDGSYPTSLWGPGEFVADEHELSIPGNLPAGVYDLAIGLYRPDSGERLPVIADGRARPDGRIMIRMKEEG